MPEYTTAEILELANREAALLGAPVLTRSTLLKWRQEGLVDPPLLVTRGRRHGLGRVWSEETLRRVLFLVRMRKGERSRWCEMRVHLWLAGFSLDLRRIRSDLVATHRITATRLNNALATVFWRRPLARTPRRLASRVKVLVASDLPGGLRVALRTAGAPAEAIDALSLGPFPEGLRRTIESFFSAAMVGDTQLLRQTAEWINAAFADDPNPEPRDALLAGLSNVARVKGLLSEEHGANLLRERLGAMSDETLVAAREIASRGTEVIRSALGLLACLVEDDPAVLPLGVPAATLGQAFRLAAETTFEWTPALHLAGFIGLLGWCEDPDDPRLQRAVADAWIEQMEAAYGGWAQTGIEGMVPIIKAIGAGSHAARSSAILQA